jgi:hypothetical protein
MVDFEAESKPTQAIFVDNRGERAMIDVAAG